MILAREATDGPQHTLMLRQVLDRRARIVLILHAARKRLVAMAQPCHPITPSRGNDAPTDDLRHAQRPIAAAKLDMAGRHHLIEPTADGGEDLISVEERTGRSGDHARQPAPDDRALLEQHPCHRLAIEWRLGRIRIGSRVSHGTRAAYARAEAER